MTSVKWRNPIQVVGPEPWIIFLQPEAISQKRYLACYVKNLVFLLGTWPAETSAHNEFPDGKFSFYLEADIRAVLPSVNQ